MRLHNNTDEEITIQPGEYLQVRDYDVSKIRLLASRKKTLEIREVENNGE